MKEMNEKIITVAIAFISAFVLLTTVASVTVLDCGSGNLCVNETDGWRDGGNLNLSSTPIPHAVDNATAEATIRVHSGTYYESVNVNKQLILLSVGTGCGKPVSDADGIGSAIRRSHDDLVLASFAAINASNISMADDLVDELPFTPVANGEPPEAPIISSSTHPDENLSYCNSSPVFSWTTPVNQSEITCYSYVLNNSASTTPDETCDTTETTKSYTNLTPGTWYFHVRAKDDAENWGPAAHFRVQIENCDTYDGCYVYADGCEDRDYYCSEGTCTYNYSNRHTDYYDGYVYYCSGDTVRKHQIFHDFYCDGGLCTEHTSWAEDQLVENCSLYDGWYCNGDVREYRDYYCSGGNCTYNVTSTENCSDNDGCYVYGNGSEDRDYYCSEGSCTYNYSNRHTDYYEEWVYYCSGDTVRKHRVFHNFSCDGGASTDHTSWVDDQLVENCSQYDGWYCNGDVREYRDYYCSGGNCTYNVTSTENCSDNDGCYVYGNGSEDRDYYCSEGSCTYNYSNRHTDYYEEWVYYCSGDTVRKHRVFHNFSCDGGASTDHTSWVDDQLVENCSLYDGWYCNGDVREYRDYYCAEGNCTYNVTSTENCSDNDGWYCNGDVREYRDYYCAGGNCTYNVTSTENCSDNDGWYCNGDVREYRDYYCAGGNCTYNVTSTENCSDNDGCYVYGDGCEDRDYYCFEGSCTYDYSNRHTDYYDGWVSYCSGDTVRKHRLFHDFYCDGGVCIEHASWVEDQLVENCSQYDGWYCNGDVREYRDYYCSGGNCTYNVTSSENCSDSDGCYVYGNGSEDRDYYCSEGACAYNYSNRHTDYYEEWVYYCANDTVRKHRLFHNYSCDGGASTDHASWVEDQLVENCSQYDGWYCNGDIREYRDYYCSGGNCTYNVTSSENCSDNDGCYVYGNGCEDRDYYCSEGNCTYNYSNRHTDYYEGWVHYCANDTVRKHRVFHNFSCDNGTCTEHTSWVEDQLVENCTDYNGWVDTGNTKWVDDPANECKEKEQKEQDYHDYNCSNGSCAYTVTAMQWVDTGNTRNKQDGTDCGTDYNDDWVPYCSGDLVREKQLVHDFYCDDGACTDHIGMRDRLVENCNKYDGCYIYGDGCEDRDYYCSGGNCTYNYSNRHTDYYDDWVYYCSDDTVRKHRLFHNFFCDGGACIDHASWVDDQLVENCTDYDGWVDTNTTRWVEDPSDQSKLKEQKAQKYRDYFCSNGGCVYIVTATQWVDTGNTKVFFGIGPSANPYPSLSGIHNGTITPYYDINVSILYTYSCAGTGGHTQYVKIWNSTDWNVTTTWDGYKGDWHNIAFDEQFTLYANETYNYTICTGSYPQIIHEPSWNATGGRIFCEEFVDVNGKRHEGWIPAIKLY